MSPEQGTNTTATADQQASTLGHERDSYLRLRGRLLVLVHIVWYAVFALAVALLVASIPLHSAQLRQICSGQNCPPGQITRVELQVLERAGWSLDAYIVYDLALNTFVVLAFFAVAVILFRRKSDDWMAIYVSFVFLIFPLGTFNILDFISATYAAYRIPALLLNSLGGAMLGIFCYLFPDGRFVPRWTRLLVPFVVMREFIQPFLPRSPVTEAFFALALVTYVFAQVYRYWHVSSPVQRQQTKWFVYGMAISLGSLVGVLVFYDFVLSTPGPANILANIAVLTAFRLVILLIPLSLMMAILRRRLWDIDLIVNRTLVYVPLTAILAGVLAVFSNLAQKFFVAVTGETNEWAPILGTLIVVAGFDPIKRGLQGLVDQHFQFAPDPEANLRIFHAQLEGRVSAVDAQQVMHRLLLESVAAFTATSGAVYLLRAEKLELVHTVGEWKGDKRLSVELTINGKQMGAVELSARRNGADYTATDRETLEKIAQVVAEAIDQDTRV